MDKKYFLHTNSLLVQDFAIYKCGLEELNYLSSENDESNCILKHESVYENTFYCDLFSVPHIESGAVLKYIEQCTSIAENIITDLEFEEQYPLYNVGFLGINFSKIQGIEKVRQITNSESHKIAKKIFYKKVLTKGTRDCVKLCLDGLYSNYLFESQALTDIEYWQSIDCSIIYKILELIDDIALDPFTGGIGQTEVLRRSNGMASKRINHEHRLTYTVQGENMQVIIHGCRLHYQ